MPGQVLGPGTRSGVGFGIQVSGPNLTTLTGTPILLQGASVSGPEFSPTQTGTIWPTAFNSGNGPNQTFFTTISSWGINVLRWPVNVWNWLADISPSGAALASYGATTPGNPATGLVDYNHTPSGGTLSTSCTGANYRNNLLSVFDLAAANNIYSIIDLHWSDPYGMPGYSMSKFGGTNTTFTSGHAQIKNPTAVDVQFWSDCAARCANRPYVMFELSNETTADTSGGAWGWGTVTGGVVANDWIVGGPFTYPFVIGNDTTARPITSLGQQSLVNAIRNVNATNVIVVPGVNFEQEISGFNTTTGQVWVGTQNALLAHKLTDPLNNFCLAFHSYPGSGTNNTPNLKDFQLGWTNPVGGTANWNFPILLTEFGPDGTQPNALTTTGSATLPGTLTMNAAIPVAGTGLISPTTIVPWPTGASTTYTDPLGNSINGTVVRGINIAAIGNIAYGDIALTLMTSVTGSGTVATGSSVTSTPTINNQCGYTLNTLNWYLTRASLSGQGAGTQNGLRSLHMLPWNINPTAGPSMWTDWLGTPTNFGLVIKRLFTTGVC